MKSGGIGTDLNIHYRLMEDKSDLRTYAHHHSLYKSSAKVQKHKHVRNMHVKIFTYCPLKWAKFLRIAPSGASIITQNSLLLGHTQLTKAVAKVVVFGDIRSPRWRVGGSARTKILLFLVEMLSKIVDFNCLSAFLCIILVEMLIFICIFRKIFVSLQRFLIKPS